MLIVFVSIGLLILSIVGFCLSDRIKVFNCDAVGIILVIMFIVGIIGTLASVSMAISNHVNVPLKQAKLDLEYETLLNEVAYVKDLQDEPVSDLTRIEYARVAEHVLEWNKKALEAQTLGNSLWTNWFYSDAERSMKLIGFY